jgi:hypothetical protein
VDKVARIDQAEPDATIARSFYGREIELGLRRLDRRFVGLDGRLELVDFGLLLVDDLLCRDASGDQRPGSALKYRPSSLAGLR